MPESNLNNHSEICFPFTLSTLPHLERFTVCAKVYLHHTNPYDECDGSVAQGFFSPIPAIIHALKTISPHALKRLTLNFDFRTKCFRPLPPGDVVWDPLVRLVAESKIPSIHFNVVGVVLESDWGERLNAPNIVPPSLADCAALMEYVKGGVLVITPQLPITVEETSLVGELEDLSS